MLKGQKSAILLVRKPFEALLTAAGILAQELSQISSMFFKALAEGFQEMKEV
jgi:hypothetical protein